MFKQYNIILQIRIIGKQERFLCSYVLHIFCTRKHALCIVLFSCLTFACQPVFFHFRLAGSDSVSGLAGLHDLSRRVDPSNSVCYRSFLPFSLYFTVFSTLLSGFAIYFQNFINPVFLSQYVQQSYLEFQCSFFLTSEPIVTTNQRKVQVMYVFSLILFTVQDAAGLK